MFSKFFFSENCAVYEIIWKNSAEHWVTTWRKRILCWIPKPTHTRGVCNVTAFPPQHWLHEPKLRLCSCADPV